MIKPLGRTGQATGRGRPRLEPQPPAALERHGHTGEPLGSNHTTQTSKEGRICTLGGNRRVHSSLVVLCVFSTAGQASVALAQGSTNGAAGQMPAFYEGELVTVNMKEMPDNAA